VVSRPGDLVARFGGEEFAVILPNTGPQGAVEVANQICASLRGRQIPHTANSPGIMTVSVGCATAVPCIGDPATTLIESADQALYRAKRSGRNCVCSGPDCPDGPDLGAVPQPADPPAAQRQPADTPTA
jgi:diguanylate cyclase (GGDEF)-like protein